MNIQRSGLFKVVFYGSAATAFTSIVIIMFTPLIAYLNHDVGGIIVLTATALSIVSMLIIVLLLVCLNMYADANTRVRALETQEVDQIFQEPLPIYVKGSFETTYPPGYAEF